MKKLILSLLSLAFISNIQAQTLTQDFQSGDRNVESAKCWAFGAFGFTANTQMTVGNAATASWVGRSNQLTSALTSACWVKSPWFKPKAGNITFKTRLDGGPGTSRGLKILWVTYDPNAVSASKESAQTEFYSFNFPTATTTATQNISVPMPAILASSTNQAYKIQISYIGTGGTGRAFIDDIVIPGEYWGDPSNLCLPKALIQDADNDGVADADDAYPNDATRAYNTFYPSSGFGTLLFEDLWPGKGDYDFNDLVTDYKVQHVTNAQNRVVESKYTVILRATGGTFQNGLALQFKGLAANKIISVSGAKIRDNVFTLAANGTESGVTTGASVPLFDNAYKILQHPGQGIGINTTPGVPFVKPDTMNITITYRQNGAAAPGGDVVIGDVLGSKADFFMVVNKVRGVEVHMMGNAPTNLADRTKFGTLVDASNASTGKWYVSKDGLPYALFIESSIPYAKEKSDITKAYLKLIDWSLSGGASFTDWFRVKSGYRNTAELY